jgi:hypothetical protein
MNDTCQNIQANIAPALLGDLPVEETARVNRHVAECAACAAEQQKFEQLFRQMDTARETEPPRHFFVYPEEKVGLLQRLFRTPGRRWALAAGIAAILLASVTLSGRLWLRWDNGTFMLGLGTPPAIQTQAELRQELESFRVALLSELTSRDRRENLRNRELMRQELASWIGTLSRQQQDYLELRLTELENSFGERLQTTETTLRDGTEQQVAGLYSLLQDERKTELQALNDRIIRLASRSEFRADQTDVILATLLEVSDPRMRSRN